MVGRSFARDGFISLPRDRILVIARRRFGTGRVMEIVCAAGRPSKAARCWPMPVGSAALVAADAPWSRRPSKIYVMLHFSSASGCGASRSARNSSATIRWGMDQGRRRPQARRERQIGPRPRMPSPAWKKQLARVSATAPDLARAWHRSGQDQTNDLRNSPPPRPVVSDVAIAAASEDPRVQKPSLALSARWSGRSASPRKTLDHGRRRCRRPARLEPVRSMRARRFRHRSAGDTSGVGLGQ